MEVKVYLERVAPANILFLPPETHQENTFIIPMAAARSNELLFFLINRLINKTPTAYIVYVARKKKKTATALL